MFHTTKDLFINVILGFSPASGGGYLRDRVGPLGQVEAFFGTVESQGRGALHLHMLIYLSGCSSASLLSERLRDVSFKARFLDFVDFIASESLPSKDSMSGDGVCASGSAVPRQSLRASPPGLFQSEPDTLASSVVCQTWTLMT